MSSLLLAFTASLVGGLIAAAIEAIAEEEFRRRSHQFGERPIEFFPQLPLLRTAALSVIGAWVAIAICLLSVALGATALWRSESLVLGSLGAFVGLALIYGVLAFSIKCPACSRHLLIQSFSKPPFGERIFGFDAWASIVLRVTRRQPFRCMYCGQQYVTSLRAS